MLAASMNFVSKARPGRIAVSGGLRVCASLVSVACAVIGKSLTRYRRLHQLVSYDERALRPEHGPGTGRAQWNRST
jgi:hypothetical protein